MQELEIFNVLKAEGADLMGLWNNGNRFHLLGINLGRVANDKVSAAIMDYAARELWCKDKQGIMVGAKGAVLVGRGTEGWPPSPSIREAVAKATRKDDE